MGEGSVTARHLFANRGGLQSVLQGEPSGGAAIAPRTTTLAERYAAPTELAADLTDIYKDSAPTELLCYFGTDSYDYVAPTEFRC